MSLKTVVFYFPFLFIGILHAQQEDEILLTFRHPSVGHVYVNSLYSESQSQGFLPILELFNMFSIYVNPEISNFTVNGLYIKNDLPFTVDLKNQFVKLGEKEYKLSADDFRIGTLDFFLSPKIFEEVFGLHFTIDVLQLSLSMETDYIMPVQEAKKRDVLRKKINENNKENKEFPLLYKHKKHWLKGGLMDYNLTGDYKISSYNLYYNLGIGLELFGGDFQTRIFGSQSNVNSHEIKLNSLRWRYAILNSELLTNIMIGNLNTTGLQGRAINGVAFSNDPIEPKKTFNTYVIDGNTEANSEVELYENDKLIEFKRSDELGYYRFDIPLNYGTSRLSIHIFTNTGQSIIIDRQIEVPFTFIPKGKIQYQAQAGKTLVEDELLGPNAIISHAKVAYGLTNWLSTSVGSDYIVNSFEKQDPFLYGSVNARVASQYLFKLDAAPEAFYRLTGSVTYSNNRSLFISYTNYTKVGPLNVRGINDEYSVNLFMPFTIFGNSFGLRLGCGQVLMPESFVTNYQISLNSRIGPVNMRLNYTDFFTKSSESLNPGRSNLNSVFTYTLKRTPGIPIYLRGVFIRSQTSINLRENKIEQTELQISKSARKTGRINLNLAYSFGTKSFSIQSGIIVDLKSFRSNTNFQTNGKNLSLRQTFNGSVGYDNNFKKFIPNPREQVGRAAASVLLYVDLNNSGKYDRGDERLPYKAVKLDQTSSMKVGKDGILRITQLQAYHKYKLSVNRAAIPNPTLVPLISELSFMTDPNQYKRIEIPFYRGGTIGGTISIRKNKVDEGQGGLKLIIKDVNTDYTQTVKTFSDGGFFLMDLPPGEYTLEVDPNQLRFLNATEETKTLEFEIKALADGDFIENLDMTIFVKNKEDEKK